MLPAASSGIPAAHFQDSGSWWVTANTIIQEPLCGQAVGKGDPKKIFEEFQIFHKSPEAFLSHVISTLLSGRE